MQESCDKNVIVPLRGEMAGETQNPSRNFPLSVIGLVKGEILALLTCTCRRVGKSCPNNVTDILLLIVTGCSCFDRKLGLYDCYTSKTRLPTGVPTEYLTTTRWALATTTCKTTKWAGLIIK